jgi:hypothetical protein
MARRPKYKERYCAFVDILGFRQLIDRLDRDEIKFQLVRNLLQTIHAPAQNRLYLFEQSDFRAQSISDAIALSAKPKIEGLWQLLHSLETLSLELLEQGYFVRGAVVRGRLYHDEQIVFGSALVRAYELESAIAKFPRIMVTSDVGRDVSLFQRFGGIWENEFRDRIRQATDGPLFLHFLRKMQQRFEGALVSRPRTNFGTAREFRAYREMRDLIQLRLRQAIDNPNHFEKIKWFASYWNECVPKRATGFEPITSAELIPAFGLATEY